MVEEVDDRRAQRVPVVIVREGEGFLDVAGDEVGEACGGRGEASARKLAGGPHVLGEVVGGDEEWAVGGALQKRGEDERVDDAGACHVLHGDDVGDHPDGRLAHRRLWEARFPRRRWVPRFALDQLQQRGCVLGGEAPSR
ncbi:unnamed protein product [Urochloa humidicola]